MKTKIAIAAVSAAIAAAVIGVAAPAAADDLQVAADVDVAAPAKVAAPPRPAPLGLEVGFYFFDAKVAMDHTLHAVGSDMPTPLADRNLRLTGAGSMPGGEMRITFLPRFDPVGRTRIGFGIGFMGVSQMAIASAPLPASLSVTPGKAWGVKFEGHLGHDFPIGPARRPWLVPYVDMVATGNILQTKLDLSVDKLGYVGTTTLNAYDFSIGPRAGVAIPLGPFVSLDVGGYKGLYGAERYGGFAGLKFTTP